MVGGRGGCGDGGDHGGDAVKDQFHLRRYGGGECIRVGRASGWGDGGSGKGAEFGVGAHVRSGVSAAREQDRDVLVEVGKGFAVAVSAALDVVGGGNSGTVLLLDGVQGGLDRGRKVGEDLEVGWWGGGEQLEIINKHDLLCLGEMGKEADQGRGLKVFKTAG